MSLLAEKLGNVDDDVSLFEQACAEISAGLKAPQKKISPKYFYDERGSKLFDEICDLPEYYPTRTEHEIMQANLREISTRVGPGAAVIEFGAGSNAKARRLLRHLEQPIAYVPVEISGEYLASQAAELRIEFPGLSIEPVVADFTKPFELPVHATEPKRNLIFFPGSTIGNFTRTEARQLLEVMRTEAKSDGALLIGVDLIKKKEIVLPAYNDSQGITAQFNLNVLQHLNTTLGTDFDLNGFVHEAVYDERFERIEMRLISLKPQSVRIAGKMVTFDAGEHIVTEYSHKYSLDSFRALVNEAGWTSQSSWVDDDSLFSVHLLTA